MPRSGCCLATTATATKDDRLAWIERPSWGATAQAELLDTGGLSARHLGSLAGEFAFIALEPERGLVAARSCGGLVPIYFARRPGFLVVATRLADLFRFAPDELAVDPLVNAIWATGSAVFPDERTFFRDAAIVPRAHFIRGSYRGVSRERYWDPRPASLPRPSANEAAERVAELRQHLISHLADNLNGGPGNLLTLSGGVDSSAVAALAAGHLKRPLATLTFLAPPENPARAEQIRYIEPLLDELGVTERLTFEVGEAALEDLMSRPLPTLFHCPHPALRLLASLRPFATLSSGHFADELCGYSQRLQDWVHHTALPHVLFGAPVSTRSRDLGRWVWRRAQARLSEPLLPVLRELGGVVAPELDAELGEWSERTRRRMLDDRRPLRELAALAELDGWVAMHWEATSVFGTRPVHPFFNRRSLELAFRCHPVELFGPGTKKILRRALKGLVPERNLQRPDKGHWHTPRPTGRPPWSGSLGALQACVRPSLLRDAATGTPLAWRRQLEQLRLFNERLNVEIALRTEGRRKLEAEV